MAVILTKKSDTASSVPTSGALTNSSGGAEIAVNTADKRLFTKDSGGTVVELGTNPSSLSLPNGTANAVPYLNGSKVLTSGSALTFDGTNFKVGTGITLATGGPYFSGGNIDAGATSIAIGGSLVGFFTGGTERMRLTSTGLGIGTSSPVAKLDIQSGSINLSNNYNIGWGGSQSQRVEGNSGTGMLAFVSSANQTWTVNGTERMRLDSSGNLGLGVTPSAWSAFKAFEIGSAGSSVWSAGANDIRLAANYVYNGGGTYAATGLASQYQQTVGQHRWFTAPSGTAGNAISFTQAMTLDANGALTVIKDGSFQGVTVGRGAGSVATNTAVGASALASNTTGPENTVVGIQAGFTNTTGSELTAVGRVAAYFNNGDRNTAIGSAALYANTTGANNSSVGRASLNSNTTGSFNVAVGSSALQSNTTASNNTAVGYQAGYSNTAGNNSFFGYKAGYANTTGYNAAFGDRTLGANTTGTYNTAFGQTSLFANTTGGSNTAVGQSALESNTTASNNTALGYQAGYSNTTGVANTAVGSAALYSNTTAKDNTAVGQGALYSNTTGTGNTALGTGTTGVVAAALGSNTTGNYNVAVGNSALINNTTASNNTAVGYQAGYSNTTGSYACLFGYQAGYTSNAHETTAFGYQALKLATGAGNIAMGTQAGLNVSTGTQNAFFGYGAGFYVTTGSKNTIIGAYTGNQGGLDIRTASNYCVISDGDGNPRLVVDGSGYFFRPQSGSGAFTSGQNCWQLRSDRGSIQLSNTGTGPDNVAFFYNANGLVGYIQTNGSSTTYATSSDYRLKENIQPMTGALAKVAALKPCTYKWKVDGSGGEGFIAHELAEVCPHAVTGEKDAVDADGNPVYQGIDTSFLVATLTAAIQELKAEFDAYKATHP